MTQKYNNRHYKIKTHMFLLTTLIAISSFPLKTIADNSKQALCASCHGDDGISLSTLTPNLAGQHKDYLIKQLEAFRNGDRKDPTMNAMAANISDQEIAALAEHFSTLPRTGKVKSEKVVHEKLQISNFEFPADTYFTIKKAAEVVKLPSRQVWQGKPNMLFNAISPDGKTLLATSPSDNTVTLFSTFDGSQLATLAVGKAPKGVKVTPDGKLAYVSNQGSANISVIDINQLKIIDSIKVEAGPHNVRFTKNGLIAYATLQGGAGIAVIDTQTRKMTHVIATPGITGPHNLDLSSDEQTIFVRDFVQHVAVVDIKSESVSKVITVGNGHGGIDVFPNGKFIATAAIGDDYISVIRASDLSHFDIKVGNGPHGIRASRDNRWLYVTLTKDNQIAIIDTKTWKIHKKVSTGAFPFWVAVKGNP